jgi:hypothetical protein
MILNDFYAPRGSLITESRTYKLWESAGYKLKEAALTADQIEKIFQAAEQGATAAGSNRTLIGKGKDAASAVNTAWNDLKTKVQNSKPIQNVDALYDQAAEKLKQATGGDQGVMQYVQKYRDFAKKNPVAQSLIYSALIAAAGVSGVGVGGAAALGLFKLVDKLLQGEKFSSAAYSGAKTGALAYGAGQVGKALQSGDQATQLAPGGPPVIFSNDIVKQIQNGLITDEQSLLQALQGVSRNQQSAIWSILQNKAGMPGSGDVAAVIKALGGGVTTTESIRKTGLTEAQIKRIFESVVVEGPGWDKFKAGATQAGQGIANMARGAWTGTKNTAASAATAAKTAMGNVAQKAQTVGQNLTTKVTFDKLMTAWKKAGSPLDSEAIKTIMKQAGVSDTVIANVMGEPAPAPTSAPAQAGASTGGASTYSTITNPETGKLYTKAELRSKYSTTPTTNTVAAPATAQAQIATAASSDPGSQAGVDAPTAPTAPGDAVAKMTAKQAKKDIDKTITSINQMRPRSKTSALNYGQKAFTKAVDILATTAQPTPTAATTPAAPTWTGRATKPTKITAPPPAGAPTSAERAKLDQKIQQALATQPVAESLSWSKDFDPSRSLLRQIQRS